VSVVDVLTDQFVAGVGDVCAQHLKLRADGARSAWRSVDTRA